MWLRPTSAIIDVLISSPYGLERKRQAARIQQSFNNFSDYAFAAPPHCDIAAARCYKVDDARMRVCRAHRHPRPLESRQVVDIVADVENTLLRMPRTEHDAL